MIINKVEHGRKKLECILGETDRYRIGVIQKRKDMKLFSVHLTSQIGIVFQ